MHCLLFMYSYAFKSSQLRPLLTITPSSSFVQCGFEGKVYRAAYTWAGILSKDKAKMIKDPKRFLDHLHTTGKTFVPKTQSNCRQFGLSSARANADDDGVAIFWRTDKFDLVDLDFLAMDDKKRNQARHHALLPHRACSASL